MARFHDARSSFRTGLTITTLFCWILPIFIITLVFNIVLNTSSNQNLQEAVDTDINNAMRQVEIRLENVMEDAKAVTYDNVVSQAYREYRLEPSSFTLYRSVTDYLNLRFGRNVIYHAAFVSFLDPELPILPCSSAPGVSQMDLMRDFEEKDLPAIKAALSQVDSGLFFFAQNDNLYMIRNLLDRNFEPYAVLAIELEKTELFQSMFGQSRVLIQSFRLDDAEVSLTGAGEVPADPESENAISYTHSFSGHTLECRGEIIGLNLWQSVPSLIATLALLIFMIVPLMLLIFWLIYRNINHPIDLLIDANAQLQSGQRGYQITEEAPNTEFYKLYQHFNDMSSELKNQFEQLYKEQQALQQAKIKALQSQINPHFLNNTLEIINWEARLADNERVCSMIEALSTMLDASIGRTGRSKVPLREELKYVNAYLYISQERIGDRLIIRQEIDEDMLDASIPLLILQPLVENAVEHNLNITGGELVLRAFSTDHDFHFEVEHDGTITEEGRKKIKAALAGTYQPVDGPLDRRSVGVRNVNDRLRLLYADRYKFSIEQWKPNRVLMQIILPQESAPQEPAVGK